MIYALGTMIPGLAVAVRRLHDIGNKRLDDANSPNPINR